MSNIVKKAYSVLNMHGVECADYVERAEYTTVQPNSAYRHLKRQVEGAWIFTIALLLFTIFSPYIPYANEIQLTLALVVMVFFGKSFYINAWQQARLRRSNMDTLVALSTSAAFLFSAFNTFFPDFWYSRGLEPSVYFEVTVITISFILTGKLMEEHAKGNASTAIRQLRGLQPEAACSSPEGLRMDDRIAGVFVPLLLSFSAFTFFVWIFFGGTDMVLFTALSVLIIACPCALGLATPIALIAGISHAADNDIIIKDAMTLEQMSKVDVIVFDKAGTLTEGHPTITGWLWAHMKEEHFKNVLLAAELNSSHPLASAIVEDLEGDCVLPAEVDSWENIDGKGTQVSYQGVIYWVGSHKLLKDFQVNLSDVLGEMIIEYESDGNCIVFFGRENDLLAIIAIKDRLKATSAEAVRELRVHGIEICMLTSDGERTASAVARTLGITPFIADAWPDDKEDFIRELQLQGKTVAMVGDGMNDLQALACADVSITMARDTNAAMNAAMVTLVTSNLLMLPRAFHISRRTVRLMNKNLFWTFIYNIICIFVAAGVLYPVYGILLTPLLASVAMALSCISVLFNSLEA